MKYEVKIDKDLIDIVPDYVERRKKELDNLKKLNTESNYEEIKKIAHKMIGSGSGYGFDLISEKGRELEKAAFQQDKNKISEILNQLEDYLNNLEIIYE